MMISKLRVVSGLRAEARLFGPSAEAGGGKPHGAAEIASRLAETGATALLSFGFAGGLDPLLSSGALLVPRRVISRDAGWDADPGLLAKLGGATADALFAGEAIVASRAAKAALYRETGASAIDLESGAVARVAARHRIPFAVLRAVCDPASRDLPPAALLALDQDGVIGLGRVAGSILAHPGQIASLLRLARDAARARGTLRHAVTRLRLSAPDMI